MCVKKLHIVPHIRLCFLNIPDTAKLGVSLFEILGKYRVTAARKLKPRRHIQGISPRIHNVIARSIRFVADLGLLFYVIDDLLR